jgi:hypothetical protein
MTAEMNLGLVLIVSSLAGWYLSRWLPLSGKIACGLALLPFVGVWLGNVFC